jgi:hypothetical protein
VPLRCDLTQRFLEPVALRHALIDRATVFLESDLRPRRGEHAFRQPASMLRSPVGGAGVAHIVHEQERLQPLPRLPHVLLGRTPGAHQIAHRLVLDIGHMHARQVVHAQRLDQLDRIAPIGLDPIARLARRERGRAHHACKTLLRQQPVQPVAGWTGLVDERNPRTLALHPRAQSGDVALKNADVAKVLDLAQPDRIRRNDRVLVHVQGDMDRGGGIVLHADLRVGNQR